MAVESTIKVEVDTEIGAAYVQLSTKPVAHTVEYSQGINVDLDEHGMVVGVELLDLSVPIPLDDLVRRYHIKTDTLSRLLASIKMQAPTPRAIVTSGSATHHPTYGAIEPKEVAEL